MILPISIIEKLIQIEMQVHYNELPPPDCMPFIYLDRQSPVLISAPHGAVTYRNNSGETWHEEDEYTAGMALLLSEMCKTSVIATIWRTENSDPNYHPLNTSDYKKYLKDYFDTNKVRWIIDLHGAGQNSENMALTQLVDLGIGEKNDYLPETAARFFKLCIEKYLGDGATNRIDKRGFPAAGKDCIASFAKNELNIHSVQVEMKPSVRVPLRRIDASMYKKPIKQGGGPLRASETLVLGMMQAIVDFIRYIEDYEKNEHKPS